MTEVAGVRTITVGGRPQTGPMQTASGNRGAAVYTSNRLDFDIDNLKTLANNEAAYDSLPSRNDTGMFTQYASFNLRDQMRPNDSIPVQFRYEASDCRLYYTPLNVYNMSRLWRDVATATWDDTTRCVPDSTTYSKRTNNAPKAPPKRTTSTPAPIGLSSDLGDSPLNLSLNTSIGLTATRHAPNFNKYQRCTDNSGCSVSLVCALVTTSCSGNKPDGAQINLCLEGCNNLQGSVTGCKPLNSRLAQSTAQQPVVAKRNPEPQHGGLPPVGSAKPPPTGKKPAAALPQGFTFPPLTSAKTLGESVYNGYVQPGLLKTSEYFQNAPGCVV